MGFAWSKAQTPERSVSAAARVQDKFLSHTMSCDCCGKVQNYIRKTQDPLVFCSDIKDASEAIVLDAFSGKHVCNPRSPMCVCSWVCHDVSEAQCCKGYDRGFTLQGASLLFCW